MMTLIEEMRLAVLALWQSLGLETSSRTAAAVVPALVLGVALNVVAMSVVGGVHLHKRASCPETRAGAFAHSEVKAVQVLVASTLRSVDQGQRGLCRARQWFEQRRAGAERYRSQMSCSQMAHVTPKCILARLVMGRPEASHCQRELAAASGV